METILTLDLGTTYFKTALFDRGADLVALYREPAPIYRPQAGYWEMDPREFKLTIKKALIQLAAARPEGLNDVVALSFATQTNSFLILDEHGQPLTPIILWPDSRAGQEPDLLNTLMQRPCFQAITGVPRLNHEFMVAKLLYLKRHASDLWSRARRLCLISDYLTLWVTGRHVSEGGAAGLTGLVDIHQLRWWADGCHQVGLPQIWLPAIVRMGTDLGGLVPEIADELGLPRSCRFVVGCLDQFAGAIGAGNIAAGNISETTGTVLATVRCSDRFVRDAGPEIYQGPAFDEGIYYQMVFGGTSANLLEWYRNQLPGHPDFELLDLQAESIPPGADGVRVREGADQGTLADGFTGLADRHHPGQGTRAIMEKVAYVLGEQVDKLCGSYRPSEIHSCGGAARSRLWLQIKADVLNIPFVSNACPEPTSLGAAMLAARAIGWGQLPDLAAEWIQTRWTCHPSLDRHKVYSKLRY